MKAFGRIFVLALVSTLLFVAIVAAFNYLTLVLSARCSVEQWADLVVSFTISVGSTYGVAVLVGGLTGWDAHGRTLLARQSIWVVGLALIFSILWRCLPIHAAALEAMRAGYAWFVVLVLVAVIGATAHVSMRLLTRDYRTNPTAKKGPWDR